MKVGSEYYFYQNDHLGTPQKMTTISGAVVWSAKYSSFGKAQVDPVFTVVNNLRFPGQYYDQENELNYNLWRYYDIRTGRYLEKDPIGLKGGLNYYIYAQQNSINFSDELGLFSAADIDKAWSHYCDGTESPWYTNFSSIDWGNVRSRINERVSINPAIGKCQPIKTDKNRQCQPATIPINFDIAAYTEGADEYIIGRHTLRVVGQLSINCDCTWTFNGKMSSARGFDPYNFNPSNRGFFGETAAMVGRSRCSKTGKTFNIHILGSESLSFSGP